MHVLCCINFHRNNDNYVWRKRYSCAHREFRINAKTQTSKQKILNEPRSRTKPKFIQTQNSKKKLKKKACELGLPYCFLTDFTKFCF